MKQQTEQPGITESFELQAELNRVVQTVAEVQAGFDFPQPLVEKYRPRTLDSLVGLEKPKNIMRKLIAKPFRSAWFFLGPSGLGKTTLALIVAELMPAEIHHIASKECTLETVKEIARQCHFSPRMADNWHPCRMHLVLVDEADQMSYPAQLAFLSLLDETGWPPNTIFIFTGNSRDNLEDRFMSRCKLVEFSSYGISAPVADLLRAIWTKETDNPVDAPDFARIVKDSKNNVRDALNTLETEMMSA